VERLTYALGGQEHDILGMTTHVTPKPSGLSVHITHYYYVTLMLDTLGQNCNGCTRQSIRKSSEWSDAIQSENAGGHDLHCTKYIQLLLHHATVRCRPIVRYVCLSVCFPSRYRTKRCSVHSKTEL